MFKIYERPGCCKCASIIHQTTITLLQETWVRKNFADTSHRSPVSSIEKIQNPTLYKFALANNKKIKKIGPIQYGKLIYRLEKINTSIVEGKKKKKTRGATCEDQRNHLQNKETTESSLASS